MKLNANFEEVLSGFLWSDFCVYRCIIAAFSVLDITLAIEVQQYSARCVTSAVLDIRLASIIIAATAPASSTASRYFHLCFSDLPTVRNTFCEQNGTSSHNQFTTISDSRISLRVTGEHNHLHRLRLLLQQLAGKLHAIAVRVDEIIVKDHYLLCA
jgi:hypothetical protein